MSVTERATPAPIISFRVSIHISRILSPSFVWHGSLNKRLVCNDQFSVPDSLPSHTNTFIQTGRTAAPASHTARVINKSLTQPWRGSICRGWTLTKPAAEHLALKELLAEGVLKTAECDHIAAVTHFLFILYDSHRNIN